MCESEPYKADYLGQAFSGAGPIFSDMHCLGRKSAHDYKTGGMVAIPPVSRIEKGTCCRCGVSVVVLCHCCYVHRSGKICSACVVGAMCLMKLNMENVCVGDVIKLPCYVCFRIKELKLFHDDTNGSV